MLLELHGWLPDLLEAHLETLEVLWPTWSSARASAEYAWDELARLEARIEANLDALVLAGDEAEALVETGLGSEAPGVVLAAALVRARLGRSAEVIARMEAASPAAALAMGEAIGFSDDPIALPASESPVVTVALARALALRGKAIAAPDRVVAATNEGDPALRGAAWRVTGDLVARGAIGAPARDAWIAAIADVDVAEHAAWAAAWSRQPWLLPHLRARATKDPLALRWLAILGGPSDRAAVIAAMQAGGPAGLAQAAALGHVEVADALLEHTAAGDAARAVAAGEAFWRITDHRRVLDATVTLGDPDDDLADTAHPPDPAALRSFWRTARGAFASGDRWSRAVDVDRAELDRLDAQARAERVLREVHQGQRRPELAIVERYPLLPRL